MPEVINVKILHLVVKKKWYEMQESGEKTEEYRELSPYWRKRLIDQETLCAKPYTHVCFHYGYTQRCFINRIDSITIGMGFLNGEHPPTARCLSSSITESRRRL